MALGGTKTAAPRVCFILRYVVDVIGEVSGLTRGARAVLGALLVTIGLVGMLSLSAISASAEEGSREESHGGMHEMMDAMHGPTASNRMHRVEGAEQMMDQCSRMHDQMGGMMDGGGMMDMMPR